MAEEEAEVPTGPVPKKCLFVLTSVAQFPDESPTGFYLSEVAHPHIALTAAGWECSFVSIEGSATVDPSSLGDAADAECTAWWADETNKAACESAGKLAEVCAEVEATVATYDAIYFAGGYGTMWDFAASAESQALIKGMYEAGKVVSAVCHGPIALANVALSDESKLLDGKECTGFTNSEEAKMGKTEVVAEAGGSCQTAMAAAGGIFKDGGDFEVNVVQSGNLITGQNPASAGPLATAIIYFFDKVRAEFEPPRLALLKERATLAAEVAAANAAFEKELAELKKSELLPATAEKIESLQLKATAGHNYRAGRLAVIDSQLERNALLRQAKLDADAAAAAAAAEEE